MPSTIAALPAGDQKTPLAPGPPALPLTAPERGLGTLDRAAVEPRPILAAALLRRAAAILVFHTHPSGYPDPSAEDLLFTRRLQLAAELVDLVLVDHLVISGPSTWCSLRPAIERSRLGQHLDHLASSAAAGLAADRPSGFASGGAAAAAPALAPGSRFRSRSRIRRSR